MFCTDTFKLMDLSFNQERFIEKGLEEAQQEKFKIHWEGFSWMF